VTVPILSYQQAWDDMIKAEELGFPVTKDDKQKLHDILLKDNLKEPK
jgi:hypothetical protein